MVERGRRLPARRAALAALAALAAVAFVAIASGGLMFRRGVAAKPPDARVSANERERPISVPPDAPAARASRPLGKTALSATASPAELLAFLEQEPADGDRARLIRDALASWAEADAAAANRWAAGHGELHSLLAGLCASGDYPLAVGCADRASTDGGRKEMVIAVFESWIQGAPAAAAAALATWSGADGSRETTLAIAHDWAGRDGRGAAEFAAKLPAGGLRQAVFEQLASTWVARDPAAAAEWSSRLAPGPERDTLAVALASEPAWLSDHLDWALAANRLIVSDEARLNNLAVILQSSRQRDASAGEQFPPQ